MRDVKRLRRIAVEDEVVNVGKCWFCKKVAVDTFLFVRTNKTFPLCKFHVREFVSSRGNWRVVQKEDSVESVRKECL